MPTLQDVEGWKGRTVVDPDGDKVGTLEEFYLDRQSGDPTWAAIRTGLFGTHTSLAPLDGAALSGNDVRLGYSKSAVKEAPRPEVEGELTRDEERRLFDHYGSAGAAAQPEPSPEPEAAAPGPERPLGVVEAEQAAPEAVVPDAPTPPPAPTEPAPEPVAPAPSISAVPEPPEPEPVPTAVQPEPEPEPAPAPAPTPAPTQAPAPAPTPVLAERSRSEALERFSEGWLIDGTLVQPRRARLRRYVITEELILEADGTESSRIVGKEPYPDEVDEG
jgi:hypothetical protein